MPARARSQPRVERSEGESRADAAGHDQPLAGPRQRDVGDAATLLGVRRLGVLDGLVVGRRVEHDAARVRHLQAEPTVGQEQRGRPPAPAPQLAARVGQHDHRELEALRGVHGQQAHGVAALVGHGRLRLAAALGAQPGHAVEEALQARPAHRLVAPRQPRELLQVREAPDAVAAAEDGEVVVVVVDDALDEARERQAPGVRDEAVEAPAEALDAARVGLGEGARHAVLDAVEQRALGRARRAGRAGRRS